MASVNKKRVDWGTARSKSGKIDVSLASSTFKMMSQSDENSSPPARSLLDMSVLDINEIGETSEKMPPSGDITDFGHETDKTQAMQVSSRTLDGFDGDDADDDDSDDVEKERKSSTYKQVKKGLHRFREACGSVVNHPHFQSFVIFLIVINSIMMGLGTFDFVTEDPEVSAAFEKVDMAFLVIFTIEITMQLIYHGFRLFIDGWLLFDFVIVLISWSLSSLQIIRAFRIFRALRLVTRVETLRKLVTALLNVMPKMGAIGMLLLLIFYIFAVMFTVLFKDLYEQGLTEEDYFSGLTISLFTLLQMMTMDWSEIARQCMEVYKWAWAPFVAFIMISGFIVFNLIIAVVCDAVATVDQNDEEDKQLEKQGKCDCEMKEDTEERVRELRAHVQQLVRNQREMQGVIQSIVKKLSVQDSQAQQRVVREMFVEEEMKQPLPYMQSSADVSGAHSMR